MARRPSLRSVARLLRRAASVLDPPVETAAPRSPGRPPEHWLALVTAHAPGLLRDRSAPDEGIRTTAYPDSAVASDFPAPVASPVRPLPIGPALVTPTAPFSRRIRDVHAPSAQDSPRIPDPLRTPTSPGTPVPPAVRPGRVDPAVPDAVVTRGRDEPVGPARWPALSGEPAVAAARWSTTDTGSAGGEVPAARVTPVPPLPLPSAAITQAAPFSGRIRDPGRILGQDSTEIPDPVRTRGAASEPTAPARRPRTPADAEVPRAVSPWPELPDDAELWAVVPPLFTADRLARLDREQAGG
ncbi:MAG: hypothetical protein HOV71_20595 [Hamadaea sp.]|nr:hypothetical protein [Hamadaea sp.]NUR70066.1 hypothetical protein [Hamadaea sp.]